MGLDVMTPLLVRNVAAHVRQSFPVSRSTIVTLIPGASLTLILGSGGGSGTWYGFHGNCAE